MLAFLLERIVPKVACSAYALLILDFDHYGLTSMQSLAIHLLIAFWTLPTTIT